MKNIVIFYISDFGGHRKAAENIKEALHHRNPQLRALIMNGLGHFYPRSEKIIDFIYTTVIKHFPKVWGRVYDRKKIVRNLSPVRRMISELTFDKISDLINELDPVCFVATQAFPCGLIADYKKRFHSKIPLVGVVTDYYPHRFWVHPCVDQYVVASTQAKKILIKEGIDSNKIKILGIPISIKFLNSYSRESIAKEYDFQPNLPSVLIMGGGLGIGPLEEIAQKLDKLSNHFQIIAVCGKNKKLLRWFNKNKTQFRKPIYPLGYINYVHKLMDFSDIIITKGGGITISEALVKGMAIIITNPIPGQEERNVDFLSHQGAIVKADVISDVVDNVKELLSNPKKMYELKEQAKAVSAIDSSLRITDLILGEIA